MFITLSYAQNKFLKPYLKLSQKYQKTPILVPGLRQFSNGNHFLLYRLIEETNTVFKTLHLALYYIHNTYKTAVLYLIIRRPIKKS